MLDKPSISIARYFVVRYIYRNIDIAKKRCTPARLVPVRNNHFETKLSSANYGMQHKFIVTKRDIKNSNEVRSTKLTPHIWCIPGGDTEGIKQECRTSKGAADSRGRWFTAASVLSKVDTTRYRGNRESYQATKYEDVKIKINLSTFFEKLNDI